MKILQVGDNDLYCRKFAGHDLHLYLNQVGNEASHLVWQKLSRDKTTYQMAANQPYRDKTFELIRHLSELYGLNAIQNPLVFDVMYDPHFLKADVVHYHLIHNYLFDLNFLPIMSRLKPTVWTFHDPWPLYGHCIYNYDCQKWQQGCGDCPRLKTPFKIPYDNSALNFLIKRQVFNQVKMEIVVASKWMQQKTEESSFINHQSVHVVNYGIDQTVFKPMNKLEIRLRLKIPPEALVLAFRCTDSEFKGLDYIKYVLDQLPSKQKIVCLLLEGKFSDYQPKFPCREFGWVTDDKCLRDIYNAADLFLMPSKAEAFGMMAIEAMSCGTLPIVLKGTALPEIVNAPDCGVATEINKQAYLKAVKHYLIDDKEARLARAQKCVTYAQTYYAKELYRNKLMAIYGEAKDKFKLDDQHQHLLTQLQKKAAAYHKHTSHYNQLMDYQKYDTLLAKYQQLATDHQKMMNRKIMKYLNYLDKFRYYFRLR
jgi:glycosyltransferase involved in cell wall biosynthesis